MTDPRTILAQMQKRAAKATEGPWAAWLDQDGQPHMNHMLMVGNADAVIPEGESWVENVDVNPVAHTYTPEDREFIAHARTEHPTMAAALQAVLELLDHAEKAANDSPARMFGGAPFPAVLDSDAIRTAITEHLTKEDV